MRSLKKWLYRSRPEGFKKDGRLLAPWWIHALPGKVVEARDSWWIRLGKYPRMWEFQFNRNTMSDGWSISFMVDDRRSLRRKV